MNSTYKKCNKIENQGISFYSTHYWVINHHEEPTHKYYQTTFSEYCVSVRLHSACVQEVYLVLSWQLLFLGSRFC